MDPGARDRRLRGVCCLPCVVEFVCLVFVVVVLSSVFACEVCVVLPPRRVCPRSVPLRNELSGDWKRRSRAVLPRETAVLAGRAGGRLGRLECAVAGVRSKHGVLGGRGDVARPRLPTGMAGVPARTVHLL